MNVDLFIKYTKNWDAGHAGKSSTSRIGKLLLPVLARGKEIYFVAERKGQKIYIQVAYKIGLVILTIVLLAIGR